MQKGKVKDFIDYFGYATFLCMFQASNQITFVIGQVLSCLDSKNCWYLFRFFTSTNFDLFNFFL